MTRTGLLCVPVPPSRLGPPQGEAVAPRTPQRVVPDSGGCSQKAGRPVGGTEQRIERRILHRQLADILRAESQRLPGGAALPSEHQLAQKYGVSRQTVRRAMIDLVAAGLVERRQGKGTYVRGDSPAPRPVGGSCIGVLVAHLDSWFVLDALAGIERVAAQGGFGVILRAVGEDGADATTPVLPAGLEQMRRLGAQGLVAWPLPSRSGEAEAFDAVVRGGIPVVFFDRYLPGSPIPHVVSDNFRGGQDLGRHLLGLGHRRLGWLWPREVDVTSVRERWSGVRAAVAAAGLGADALQEAPTGGTAAGVRAAVQGLLAQDPSRRPSALLCGSDHLAPAALATLRALGLAVPGDVALTGFDDLPYAAWLEPPLTTVRQSPRLMGETAATLLLGILGGGRPRAPNAVLPVELRVRASSASAGTTAGASVPAGGDGQGGEPAPRWRPAAP
jgi:DNA-binding LacI/PurR family transcriptional regulator